MMRLILSIFLILFLTSSYVVTNDIISSELTIAGWLFLLAVSLLSIKKMDRGVIIATIIAVLIMFTSSFVNGEPMFRTIALAVAFVTVALFSNTLDFNSFKKAYSNVLAFLSLISLVLFFLYLFVPSLSSINPVGMHASNLFIYVDGGYGRNMGMFWEPGAFQAFISIAMLFTVLETSIDFKKLILFVVTIVTTFSTTGYVAIVIIMIILAIRWKSIEPSTKKAMKYFAIPVLGVFLYLSADALFDTSSNSVFGKLIAFNEDGGLDGNVDGGSVAIRYFAIVKPIEAFFESPFLGKGYEGLQNELFRYTMGMNTCTFVNWFAVYGIFYGLLMIIGLIKFSKRVYPSHLWLVMLFLFIISVSENFANNATLFLLALWGYKKLKCGASQANEFKILIVFITTVRLNFTKSKVGGHLPDFD